MLVLAFSSIHSRYTHVSDPCCPLFCFPIRGCHVVRSTENVAWFYCKSFREGSSPLSLIGSGAGAFVTQVISSDNNRKAGDVRPFFHPAVTPASHAGALESERLCLFSCQLCVWHTQQPGPTPNARRDYLFISNYSVFSEVGEGACDVASLPPDGSCARLSLPPLVPVQLPAADWSYSCHGVWIWLSLLIIQAEVTSESLPQCWHVSPRWKTAISVYTPVYQSSFL